MNPESPGMVASRLHLRGNSFFSLTWDGLLDLAVDAYWARRNDVQPVVSSTEGEARTGRHRLGAA